MTRDAFVELHNVCKSFDSQKESIVKNLSLEIKKGEFLTMLGPSGCGKTTTLRMIAGFEQVSSGKIIIDGEEVTNKSSYKRCVNTVFQNYALFPHMNVFENIAFGLKMKKISKEEITTRVKKILKTIQLEGFENRMPSQLSGGQKQRVAIARAIINNPKVLLLDEPLGALDLKLRKQMQLELKHLQRELGITFIFVTHDQEEALTMSDRILVMNKGIVEQLGTPDEIYEKPNTKFVADFIGETNLIEGAVVKLKPEETILQVGNEQDIIRVNNLNLNIGEQVCVAVRPERVKIKCNPEEGDVWLQGRLKERIYTGVALRTIVQLKNGQDLTVCEPVGENFKFNSDNEDIVVTWKQNYTVVMKA